MAKQDADKTATYLIAIVGIVAAVGIVVLLMNAGISGTLSGQAISSSICPKVSSSDCPGGGKMVYDKGAGLCTCITATQISAGTTTTSGSELPGCSPCGTSGAACCSPMVCGDGSCH